MFIHQLFTGSKVVWMGKHEAGSIHMVGNRFKKLVWLFFGIGINSFTRVGVVQICVSKVVCRYSLVVIRKTRKTRNDGRETKNEQLEIFVAKHSFSDANLSSF